MKTPLARTASARTLLENYRNARASAQIPERRTPPQRSRIAPLARWQGSLLAARFALCAPLHQRGAYRTILPLDFRSTPEADISLYRGICEKGPVAEIATCVEAINNAAQRLIYVNVRRQRLISL